MPGSFRLALIGFTLYSFMLLTFEMVGGREGVRPFFTDIRGGTIGYALNTTLTASLLWGAALLFLLTSRILTTDDKSPGRSRFYLSQAVLFLYLGCDERFLFHHSISQTFGVADWVFFGALGALELLLVFRMGDLGEKPPGLWSLLISAGALFAITVLADQFLGKSGPPAYSIEDLAKTWSAFFLFLYGWESFGYEWKRSIRSARRSGGPKGALRPFVSEETAESSNRVASTADRAKRSVRV